jgi:hypothetical protein
MKTNIFKSKKSLVSLTFKVLISSLFSTLFSHFLFSLPIFTSYFPLLHVLVSRTVWSTLQQQSRQQSPVISLGVQLSCYASKNNACFSFITNNKKHPNFQKWVAPSVPKIKKTDS